MPKVKRLLKNFSKLALRKIFEQGQRFGLDILPRHFYSEIPAIYELKNSTHWKTPYSMMGVSGADTQVQLNFVKECCPQPIIEEIKTKNIHTEASKRNGQEGFGTVEADFLFAFVGTKKPKQIFQIGCGVSTAVCLLAAEYAGYTPEIICVEPYPTNYLLQEKTQGRINLIQQKVQLLDLKIIETLSNNVLFFVDSTHTLGPGGEVSRIILEMLPRLKQGAYVHFHDIYFPYDYDRHILDSTSFFTHESVLLHAFLSYNSRFRVLASLSMLHYSSAKTLAEYLPNYQPAGNDEGLNQGEGNFPSSTYLEVVG
ncbi:MAG TPA: class I SAM-dependent methyltransferase [Allocoleopsis sp.]